MRVSRYKGRFWAVYDPTGTLVVVTVYKRGANEVKRRLSLIPEGPAETSAGPSPLFQDNADAVYRTSDNGNVG